MSQVHWLWCIDRVIDYRWHSNQPRYGFNSLKPDEWERALINWFSNGCLCFLCGTNCKKIVILFTWAAFNFVRSYKRLAVSQQFCAWIEFYKMTVFWDVAFCVFWYIMSDLLKASNGRSKLFSIVGQYLPDCTVLHPRRQPFFILVVVTTSNLVFSSPYSLRHVEVRLLSFCP